MALRYRTAGVILLLVATTLASLAFILGHDSACGPAPSLPDTSKLMKAIVYRCYGPPDVLKVEDVEKPTAADNEVLVKVHAASVNPADWHRMRGTPYIVRVRAGIGTPENSRLGVDFAGTVEAVGRNVKGFKPGDDVFGGKRGALAEYVSVAENGALVQKPANVTFEQAAGVPVAAITALQALRDKGRIQSGQRVLINGASGGVGTFAVQIAKSFGAEVTGVCSSKNMQMVRSIGADHVIDYALEDFTQSKQAYDLIVDTVGNHALLDYRRVLSPSGVVVIIGAPIEDPWVGVLETPIKVKLLSPFVSQKFTMFLASLNQEDLTILRDLMQAGKVMPVIDRRYKLSEVPAAIAYLEQGHARGKVVINLE